MLNFGQESNDKICKCGAHHGCGEWSAERRAAIHKRMQEKLPDLMNTQQIAFLASWEEAHGFVRYRMEPVGKHKSGRHKGEDILGPVFIDPEESTKADDLFRQRADIHG